MENLIFGVIEEPAGFELLNTLLRVVLPVLIAGFFIYLISRKKKKP
jgi:hypothetical protein